MKRPFLRMLMALCLSVPVLAADSGRAPGRFGDLRAWKAAPSDGVGLVLAQVPGRGGNPGLRMTFDFHGGAGYAAARRTFPVDLPANYEISFWLRGEGPSNNLEFKLVDPGGDNVWWVNKRDFESPSQWTKVVLKKRHLSFAWGPAGGGDPRSIGWIELAITAGKGGAGHVDIAGLTIRDLPPEVPYDQVPVPSASTSLAAHPPALAMDGRGDTAWRTSKEGGWYRLDFRIPREFGGLVIDWDEDDFATNYAIQVSNDGRAWNLLRKVRGGSGGRRFLALPESEGRFLRIACARTSRHRGWGIRALAVQPLGFAATPNAFFESVAKAAPRGDYPRCFLGEQSYWTIVGVDGGLDTGLLGEDGAIEAGRGGISIEPFLWSGGKLLRWSDAEIAQSLEKDYLPIPTVSWKVGEQSLQITSFGSGPAEAPVLRCRYRVSNGSRERRKMTLFLALRPFQVNPPTQFLGTPGGVAEIHDLGLRGGSITVNRKAALVPISPPNGFGAATFDQGPIIEFLHRGALPPARQAEDPIGYASGALRYDLDLEPGQSRDIFVDIPLPPGTGASVGSMDFSHDLARTIQSWEEKLNRVVFQIPDQAVAGTLRTCLAHILISRRGPALQPGTRSYARSWIRDGALISAGLLRLGHPEEVRDFIDWYAPNLFANGKVPCVVDGRGADPVPENDSHGEFIYLVAEYERFRHDQELLKRTWPQVRKAWDYIDFLTRQRRTPEFQSGEKALFYGLVPESISHEGYSAKPVHSYWDDFFTLRGLKDAVDLAGMAGEKDLQKTYGAARDRFRSDFLASIRRSMDRHGISYIPGCAELGDFDATSTTIGVAPGGELASLPREAVESTFGAFYQQFRERRDGRGQGDRYTPYETRLIGTFIQLGWVDRAHELIQFYLNDLRPRGWNQWPEVVQRDLRSPVFLGDLPHAWVGSDFIRSMLALFAYEREQDQSLVVGAGLSEAWLRSPDGVAVTGLRVPSGEINLRGKAEGERVTYELSGRLDPPPGGLVLRWPLDGTFSKATMNGLPLGEKPGTEVVIRQLPAKVVLER